MGIDYGANTATKDWDGSAPAWVLICCPEASRRVDAAARVRVLLSGVGKVLSSHEAEHAEAEAAERVAMEAAARAEAAKREALEAAKFARLKKIKLSRTSGGTVNRTIGGPSAIEPSPEKPNDVEQNLPSTTTAPVEVKATDATAPIDVKATVSKSKPLEELRLLKTWPKDNQSWIGLQETIWRGHPELALGWIRVWSRSKDREYYVRLKDGKSTFDFTEATTP